MRKRTRTPDPSRTTMIRQAFMREINKRSRKLRGAVNAYIREKDVFGLTEVTPGLRQNVYARQYEFHTDSRKVKEFRKWFQGQVDQGILEVGTQDAAWTHEYVDSSYKKGVTRAYVDTNKDILAESTSFYEGGKAQFLTSSFASAEAVSKIELIYTRVFDGLTGYTAQMSQETSRILATGLSNGWGAGKVALEMNRRISALTKKRALTIARTEIIYAHAEGQLDSFEKLGVKELGIQAEWSTAGDDRVCAECSSMDGHIFTVAEARGLIPLHPNCRCAWIPYRR